MGAMHTKRPGDERVLKWRRISKVVSPSGQDKCRNLDRGSLRQPPLIRMTAWLSCAARLSRRVRPAGEGYWLPCGAVSPAIRAPRLVDKPELSNT